MKTLKITKEHIDSDGYYIGAENVADYDGHIEIAEKLGVVRFKLTIKATGRIRASAGTGISAGDGISARDGWHISAGIRAKASWDISTRTVKCAKIESGKIWVGELVETKN